MMKLVFNVPFSVETDERYLKITITVLSSDARAAIPAAEKRLKALLKSDYSEKFVGATPLSVEKVAELS